jgi:hypothetical protein
VQTSGTGVGRLWMSEKTPPWCLSVQSLLIFFAGHKSIHSCVPIFRLAGQQMELKYMRVVGMVQLTFGMHDF